MKWKKRYNIEEMGIAGEGGVVNETTLNSWQERVRDMYLKICGIWTRLASSGKHFQKEIFLKREKDAEKEEKSKGTVHMGILC